ncbi:MAG: hypothetical protein COB66_01890 [Coxiella sp. (in: Bacteria)]|nr:MAG: hypothetical protein COB66_01890 [Coxiella sp. (in: g-proteobacteria)]
MASIRIELKTSNHSNDQRGENEGDDALNSLGGYESNVVEALIEHLRVFKEGLNNQFHWPFPLDYTRAQKRTACDFLIGALTNAGTASFTYTMEEYRKYERIFFYGPLGKIVREFLTHSSAFINKCGSPHLKKPRRLRDIALLPGEITNIGSLQFNQYQKLRNITLLINNGTASIFNEIQLQARALKFCGTLQEFDQLSSYVRHELTSITINGGGDTEISDKKFFGCGNIRDVHMHRGIRRIGDKAFGGCSSLTTVHISNSVIGIDDGAFEDCSSLIAVHIPNSVTHLGATAFRNCSSLTTVHISNSVTSIGSYAFFGCIRLTAVDIPNSVTSINNGAFWACLSLTTVNIPESVIYLYDNAFRGCTSLSTIFISNEGHLNQLKTSKLPPHVIIINTQHIATINKTNPPLPVAKTSYNITNPDVYIFTRYRPAQQKQPKASDGTNAMDINEVRLPYKNNTKIVLSQKNIIVGTTTLQPRLFSCSFKQGEPLFTVTIYNLLKDNVEAMCLFFMLTCRLDEKQGKKILPDEIWHLVFLMVFRPSGIMQFNEGDNKPVGSALSARPIMPSAASAT